MTDPPRPDPDPVPTSPLAGSVVERAELADPRGAFRRALARYPMAVLEQMAQSHGLEPEATRPSILANELTAQFDAAAAVARATAALPPGSRLALSCFVLSEAASWPMLMLWHVLRTLGVEPGPAVWELLSHGLLAMEFPVDASGSNDPAKWLDPDHAAVANLRIHPGVMQGVRVTCPDSRLSAAVEPVGQIREADSLEPIIRLAAIWQRVRLEPLRQTQQGALYKRDQERLDEDPILAEAGSDTLEPLAALPSFWLALAQRVGLITRDDATDRLVASEPSYWNDNAVHLAQMIATSWLGLRTWREAQIGPGEPAESGAAVPYLRIPLLLWLATLGAEEWVELDTLAEYLTALLPQWERIGERAEPAAGAAPPRRSSSRARSEAPSASRAPRGMRILRAVLLGAGVPLGLVRVGETRESRRPAVQLTTLGRYVLAMGPPPPPRPIIDHFLFVQPNLEIIAYRQGLSPQLVGQFSRFAWWTKIGAAIELKLSQESVVLGLEGGVKPEQMLEFLSRYSQRPLPSLVPDAISRWASRREQVTVYHAATLLEFGSQAERDLAMATWETPDSTPFVPVAERFLLVENPQQVPTDRISSRGARDYRLPPEKCVTIEPDGVTLALDLTRSDLLIDAELSRFADALPAREPARARTDSGDRKYAVSRSSLERAAALGVTTTQLSEWFVRRTGHPPSPATRLLLRPLQAKPTVLSARRMLVLSTPSADLAEGLLQHPLTRDLIGDRLGPTALAIPEDAVEPVRRALRELGLSLDLP